MRTTGIRDKELLHRPTTQSSHGNVSFCEDMKHRPTADHC